MTGWLVPGILRRVTNAPRAAEPTRLSMAVGELPVDPVHVVRRQAVRAVIRRGDQLLMVHSTVSGDYKFPGGGIEAGESPAEALAREVLEECGVAVVHVAGVPTIVVEERRPGQESGAVLPMQFPCLPTGGTTSAGSPPRSHVLRQTAGIDPAPAPVVVHSASHRRQRLRVD